MMRMAVRPQKHQFPGGLQPITFPANNTFNRAKYSMFGYTQFDVLLIGGAGGRSGIAEGRNVGGRTFVHSSGGGGGGSLIYSGYLPSLSATETVTIGAQGTDGADGGNDVPAGDGVNGGNTVFAGLTANGGQGGQGGRVDVTTGGFATVTAGQGGSGGSNSASAGSGGVGGISASWQGNAGAQFGSNGTSPTNGVMSLVSVGPGIIAGGRGGGGGRAEERLFGTTQQGPSDGATGHTSFAGGVYSAQGGSSAGLSKGGNGGGCNAQVYTGIDQSYGDNSVGGIGHGLVVIKLS